MWILYFNKINIIYACATHPVSVVSSAVIWLSCTGTDNYDAQLGQSIRLRALSAALLQRADTRRHIGTDKGRLAEAHLDGLLVPGIYAILIIVGTSTYASHQLHLLLLLLLLLRRRLASVHEGGIDATPAEYGRDGTSPVAIGRLARNNQQFLLGQTTLLRDTIIVLIVGIETAAGAALAVAMMQPRTTSVAIAAIVAARYVDDVVVGGIEAGQHVLELLAEILIEPGVQERVVACRAHGNRVGHKKEEYIETPILRFVIEVIENVDQIDGQPAESENGDHGDQHAISALLAIPVGLLAA